MDCMDLLANAAATILGNEEVKPSNNRLKRKRTADKFDYDLSDFCRPIHSLAERTSRKLRRWSMFEFFYATIDQEYFADNEFIACLSLIGLGHVETLTRAEWTVVKGVMGTDIGRPRRFSQAFLEGERQKLNEYRGRVRQYQRTTGSPIITVGQRVQTIDPSSKRLYSGSVLSVVSSKNGEDSANYLIQYDRADVDSSFVFDTDIRNIGATQGAVASSATSIADLPSISSASRMNSLCRSLSINSSSSRKRDSEFEGSEDGHERRLERMMSQLSQLSQQSGFSLPETGENGNEMLSQVSDVSFFKVPAQKVSLLHSKSLIDSAFRDAEIQAMKVLQSCIEKTKVFPDISHLQERSHSLYKTILRCLCCLIVLQDFPNVENSAFDLDSIILALSVKVAGDSNATLNSDQLQVVLNCLTGLTGAMAQYSSAASASDATQAN